MSEVSVSTETADGSERPALDDAALANDLARLLAADPSLLGSAGDVWQRAQAHGASYWTGSRH